ncbi:MAG: hypothetical protein EP344_07260 [Bacteroidetes bacterium]|nr:MAG: hypothetical protein EP344_07260 [Bacteroidota bacterium]
MSLTAKNGADNPGRPFAIAAWVILCISLSAIWIFLPRLFRFRDFQQKVIQYLGPISMGIAVFSYTDYHDTVVHLACAVGGIALLLTILEFRKGRYYDLLALALLCLLLEAGNVVLYTTNYQIWLLPMLQKVSYACYLFTFGVTGWRIYRHIKYEDQFRPV